MLDDARGALPVWRCEREEEKWCNFFSGWGQGEQKWTVSARKFVLGDKQMSLVPASLSLFNAMLISLFWLPGSAVLSLLRSTSFLWSGTNDPSGLKRKADDGWSGHTPLNQAVVVAHPKSYLKNTSSWISAANITSYSLQLSCLKNLKKFSSKLQPE